MKRGKSLFWGNMGNSRTSILFPNFLVVSRLRGCFTSEPFSHSGAHGVEKHEVVSGGSGRRYVTIKQNAFPALLVLPWGRDSL